MQKQTLIKTNPYLKNLTQRRKGIIRSVASSSTIEGIYNAMSGRTSATKAKSTARGKSSTTSKSPR